MICSTRTSLVAPFVGLIAISLLSGCMLQNTSKPEKFRDAVEGLNEEARWGRVDLARQRVSPVYRGAFEDARAHWGKHVKIADVEVMSMKIHDDEDEVEVEEDAENPRPDATSRVQYSWYDQRDMVLYTSVLEQDWTHGMGNFYLLDERVVGGEQALLRVPEPPGEWIEPDVAPQSDTAAIQAKGVAKP